MPTTARPTRAMITVVPAKTTAPPDVALARAAASAGARPPAWKARWRVTMKSA